MRKLSLKIA